MNRIHTGRARVLASSTLRFLHITFLVTLHGARFGAACARALLVGRMHECGALLGESVARLGEALGPTFIKAGQILSSRPDLLPAAVVAPLLRLQDGVAPFPSELIPRLLEEEFGRPFEELFAAFDPVPVASASIAQVHRARLKDGRDVAVKLRRPGICRTVENDLRLFDAVARTVSALPRMRTVPLAELVNDLGTPIRQQLDFRLEAANNRRMREQFAGAERVKLPELVEEFCTGGVLTMEYLDGLRRVDSADFTREERKAAALTGLRALYKMIFADGFVHADMHPGNVFVRGWGEFVILDLGLVAQLSDSDQRDFVDFFFALVNNRGEECARIVYDNATYRGRGCDRGAFEAAMIELIAEHSSLKSHEFEVARFVYQLIEVQRRFAIRGSTKFMMTILSMVVFDGICKQLYPECDFQGEARAFLIVARYRAAGRGLPLTPRRRAAAMRSGF